MTNEDDIEPNKPPVPSVLPEFLPWNDNLSITPVKIKKVAPKVVGKKEKIIKESKKKVAFAENNYLPENLLSKPTLHTTNLLKKDLDICQKDSLSMERALKEIQLSDSFNTVVNEQMTCFLNYKLDEKKYTDLVSLQDDSGKFNTDQEASLGERKVLHVPRTKHKTGAYKPDPFEFWSDADFVTEKPCTDFDDGHGDANSDIRTQDGSNNCEGTRDEIDYLFYIYRKNHLHVTEP